MSNNSNEPLDYECCDEHEVSYMGACGLCLTEEINEMLAEPKAISLVDKDFLKAVLSFIPAPATSSDASELAKDDLLKNIESALEHGNESQCFISASTLCQAQNEIVDLRYQLAALPSTERVSVSREDLDLARQWFNAAVDTNPEYLTDDDFRSAERIEQALEKDNE
jgi:hypothetical protein